jgi:hypothetical protein
MKGTIYGNRLPTGTQVEKGWEPMGYGNKINTKNNPQQMCMKSVGHEPMFNQNKVHQFTWRSEKSTEKIVYSDLATANITQQF